MLLSITNVVCGDVSWDSKFNSRILCNVKFENLQCLLAYGESSKHYFSFKYYKLIQNCPFWYFNERPVYSTILWIIMLLFLHFSEAEIGDTAGMKPSFCFLADNSKTWDKVNTIYSGSVRYPWIIEACGFAIPLSEDLAFFFHLKMFCSCYCGYSHLPSQRERRR